MVYIYIFFSKQTNALLTAPSTPPPSPPNNNNNNNNNKRFSVCQEVSNANSKKLTELRVLMGTMERDLESSSLRASESDRALAESARRGKSLTETISRLERESSAKDKARETQVKEIESKLSAAGNVNAQLNRTIAEITARANALEESLEERGDETDGLGRRCEDLEKQVRDDKDLRVAFAERERKAQEERAVAIRKQRSAEAEAGAQRARAENAKRLLEEATEEIEKLRDDVVDRDEKISELKRNFHQSQDDLSSATSRLQRAQSEISLQKSARASREASSRAQLSDAHDKSASLSSEVLKLTRAIVDCERSKSEEIASITASCDAKVRSRDDEARGLRERIARGSEEIERLMDREGKEKISHDEAIREIKKGKDEEINRLLRDAERREAALSERNDEIKGMREASARVIKGFVEKVEGLELKLGEARDLHGRQRDEMKEVRANPSRISPPLSLLSLSHSLTRGGSLSLVVRSFRNSSGVHKVP